jgi:hypothetical protein
VASRLTPLTGPGRDDGAARVAYGRGARTRPVPPAANDNPAPFAWHLRRVVVIGLVVTIAVLAAVVLG